MPDPFEALRRPSSPVRPDPVFAVALRRRLEEELSMTTTSAPVSTGQVGIIHIRTADADRAFAFFSELLGWQSEPYRSERFTAHYILNTKRLTVLTDDPDAPPVRIFYPTQDVAAAVARVEELGGRVVDSEVADDGGGWARFEDPQGVGFGLWRENNRYARDHENVTPARGEVGYLTIGAPDGPRARVFYQELLGWQFRPAQPNDYHHVDNTELPLGVLGGGTGPEVKLYLRIDDLDGLTARVTELGGGITSEDESPSGRTAECVDDQGAPFCLWEPAAGY